MSKKYQPLLQSFYNKVDRHVYSDESMRAYGYKKFNEIKDLPYEWFPKKSRKVCKECGQDIGWYLVSKEQIFTSPFFSECKCNKGLASDLDAKEAEDKETERRREKLEEINNSGIPKHYYLAEINKCDSQIQKYFNLVKDDKESDGLYIFGDTGVGKTYSACALTKMLILWGKTVKFTTAAQILSDVKSGFRDGRIEPEIFAPYLLPDFLVIDDLGKGKATEWASETLFYIIDKRYSNNKKMIVTTQFSDSSLINLFSFNGQKETAEALIRRLKDTSFGVHLKNKKQDAS